MVSRECREQLRQERRQALRRYEKQRQRNCLAEPGPFEIILVLDHLKPGFNVAKIFRSAEAFGASEVHLIDIGPFDPAPAKGAFKKVPARFHDDFAACYTDLRARGYTLYTLEPQAGEALPAASLPARSAFIFGHEEMGISFVREDYPDIRALHIPQYGPVQSLNVSIAASIVLYEYARAHSAPGGG